MLLENSPPGSPAEALFAVDSDLLTCPATDRPEREYLLQAVLGALDDAT
jgi:hypothetical protein